MASSLLTRTVSGTIYVAIIVVCILAGPSWVQLLSGAFAILACCELTKITLGLGKERTIALILDLCGLIILANGPSLTLGIIWIGVIMLRMVVELYLKSPNPVKSLSLSLGMQLYIGLPCWLMSAMAEFAEMHMMDLHVLLVLFIMIWLNDTGAYLVGSKFGRHKLCERLSPKKSIEGSVGGLSFNIIAAIIFCFFCPHYFGLPSNILIWIGLAVVVTLFATWGDLAESMLKRTLKIKDSGTLIPGHGGILDRIDSFLMVMPSASVYLYFILF